MTQETITTRQPQKDQKLLTEGAKKAKYVPVSPPTSPTQQLIASLSSGDPSVRSRSAWQLAGATELRAEARAALEPLQADADRGVRYAAAWALGHLRLPSDTLTDETPPRAIQRAKLEYPPDAYMQKIHGTVVVELLVGEEGEVSHLEVRQSIPELDAAALATLRQWRFEPGRVGGVPRASLVLMPVSFSLTVPKVIYR